MALKDKWKLTGKNTGRAFANFGKALGKTMKTVFTDDENMIEAKRNELYTLAHNISAERKNYAKCKNC